MKCLLGLGEKSWIGCTLQSDLLQLDYQAHRTRSTAKNDGSVTRFPTWWMALKLMKQALMLSIYELIFNEWTWSPTLVHIEDDNVLVEVSRERIESCRLNASLKSSGKGVGLQKSEDLWALSYLFHKSNEHSKKFEYPIIRCTQKKRRAIDFRSF